MQGISRKITQAGLYELISVAFVAPALSLAYDEGAAFSMALSVLISTIALVWNMLFNLLFEYWEVRQPSRTRTWQRRLLHSFGFEGGLTVILLPVIAYALGIGLLAALLTNLALFAFFFFYALVFQWAFDRVFDVPASAA